MNTVLEHSTDVKNILEENILEVIYHDNSDAIDEINKDIAEKQKELLELVHGKKDYSKRADEMEELRQSKQLLLVEHAKSEGVKQRINELSEYIYSEDDQITEYDEKLVRKYIDQIKVYKVTPRAPMGTRIFDLTQVLGTENIPGTEELAQRLMNESWT